MSNQETTTVQKFGKHVRVKSSGNLAAHVGPNIVAAYAREARKRNMSISRLVAKTLRCVVTGKLFDAVLDQEEG
jgi:predicted HicB family RNase H-like nuclease